MAAVRIASAFAAFGASAAMAGDARLLPGSYEVTYRLEVPHVERYAVDSIATICVSGAPSALPVLSVNNPLSRCPASGIVNRDGRLSFAIRCPGRRNERSEARAHYRLAPGRFEGRIAMVMGGKNMTFVEVQSGRRTGSCVLAGR